MRVINATMRSFSLGSLMATISVMAARALLEILGLPSISWRMPFRSRKVTKRAAALRLFPSARGWSLTTRYSRLAALSSTVG